MQCAKIYMKFVDGHLLDRASTCWWVRKPRFRYLSATLYLSTWFAEPIVQPVEFSLLTSIHPELRSRDLTHCGMGLRSQALTECMYSNEYPDCMGTWCIQHNPQNAFNCVTSDLPKCITLPRRRGQTGNVPRAQNFHPCQWSQGRPSTPRKTRRAGMVCKNKTVPRMANASDSDILDIQAGRQTDA
jgi:hypothetical protein